MLKLIYKFPDISNLTDNVYEYTFYIREYLEESVVLIQYHENPYMSVELLRISEVVVQDNWKIIKFRSNDLGQIFDSWYGVNEVYNAN